MRRVEALCIIHYTKAGMVRETALEQKISGARSRTRTGMLFKAEDFKSSMYTISSPGHLSWCYLQESNLVHVLFRDLL